MLKSLVAKGGILLNVDFATKEELFAAIAEDAFNRGLVSSKEEFQQGLLDREAQMSTELEKGVAIPHVKMTIVPDIFVYVITSQRGIKFGGLGSKVKITFLIGAPKDSQHFLDTMAMVARFLQKKELKDALIAVQDEQEVLTLLESALGVSESREEGSRNLHGLFLTLNDKESIETAMKLAVELGVKGIQVFDTTNAAAKIALNFPFLSFFASRNEQIASRTMFGVVECETVVQRLHAHLKKEDIDIQKPGAGLLFSFPLGVVFGGVDADYL